MRTMHYILCVVPSRGTISRFNPPRGSWDCPINGTAQHMERKRKRAWRKRAPKFQAMRGFAFTTISKPTNNQRLPPRKGIIIHWMLMRVSKWQRTFNNSMCQLSWSCRLKGEPLNGKRLLGKLQEQFQEERMAEIVISKTSVEVQKYTFQSL